jgi:hypothetical protein
MVTMTPQEAYFKCKNQKKRIPELEDVIATDPLYSYMYAENVIKGRFEECEKTIATDSTYSYLYARSVIKKPFHLGHAKILNSKHKNHYIEFLKSINYDISEWLL